MNFFLFTTVDASHSTMRKKIPALDIVTNRLNSLVWPLYKGTSHKDKIVVGDKCLFYIGGEKDLRRHILARATVVEVLINNDLIDDVDILTGLPEKRLVLGGLKYLDEPKDIRKILDKLSFIPNKTKYWGVALQGGCKKISAEDFQIIIN